MVLRFRRRILIGLIAVLMAVVSLRIRVFWPQVTQARSSAPEIVQAPPAAPASAPADTPRQRLPIASDTPTRPLATLSQDLARTLGAKHFVIIDSQSGVVLADRLADESYPLASLTKLLASLVIIDRASDWKQLIEILPQDLREGEPIIRVGERLEFYDLLAVTLIRSSNTGIMALARSVGLTPEQLIGRMNILAEERGWTTVFVTDPTGLIPTTVGSAHDVARILATALGRSEIASILGSSRYDWTLYSAEHEPTGKRSTISTNELIHPNAKISGYEVVGGKTGYIPESGYNVAVEAVDDQQRRLISVVMGAATFEKRFREADRLLQWAFSILPPRMHTL